MKLAIVGPSRAGKDEAANWFVANTNLRYRGATSLVILPFAADWLSISDAEAYATRHVWKDLWKQIGDESRREDPAALARITLADAELSVGIRDWIEIDAVRREALVDLVIWIDAPVEPDSTLTFGSEMADVVIENFGTIAEFHGRLERLARAMGLVKAQLSSPSLSSSSIPSSLIISSML